MMNDSIVQQINPMGFQWQTSDPFIFCVHHEDYFPKGNGKQGVEPALLAGRNMGQDFILKDGFRMYHGHRVPGFPEHPHRGFETVTVVQRGLVDHADSLGASGRYGGGDTQWMTAGSGIQHAEMFPLVREDRENTLELFQIWLNLPAKSKMVQPHYKMLWREDIPVFRAEDGKTEIVVIAGSIGGITPPAPPPESWAADPANEVAIWIIDMEAGAGITLPGVSVGINRTLYFFNGESVEVGTTRLDSYHSASLVSDREVTVKNGPTKSRLLLLQGKPIAEPMVQHGPFVMNSNEEIRQAFEDYQETRFGGWPWPSSDPTHGDVSTGRFAKHTDGRLEKRD